jgi:hypothetical protein
MPTFVETWKGIAITMGRSERWCRYMARRVEDPLPAFKVGGVVRMNLNDLSAWLMRQAARGLRGVGGETTAVAPVAPEAANSEVAPLRLIA